MRSPVLIWVEASRGLGHFRVVSCLAAALRDCGCEVVIATSRPDAIHFFGRPAAQLHVLPAHDWVPGSALSEGRVITRVQALNELIRRVRPAVFLLEMWPLRRSVFDAEIISTIQETRRCCAKSIIISLVRDVGDSPSPLRRERSKVAAKLASECLDWIMVRGDGQIELCETWPEVAELKQRIYYAGYFGPQTVHTRVLTDDWICAMGGGWFDGASAICDVLAQCYSRWKSAHSVCRVYIESRPGNVSSPNQELLIRSLDSEYLYNLSCARIGVLQAGYNSVLEALRYQVPSVFFAAQNELVHGEQDYRMRRFTELGIIGQDTAWRFVESLNLGTLAEAVADCLAAHASEPGIRVGGEKRAAEFISHLLSN